LLVGRAVAPARSNRNGGGYGSRPSPGRRIVYDALARHKISQIQFSNSPTAVIASEAKQSMAQQGSKKEWIASLRSQ
jgi:hypothetical protein